MWKGVSAAGAASLIMGDEGEIRREKAGRETRTATRVTGRAQRSTTTNTTVGGGESREREPHSQALAPLKHTHTRRSRLRVELPLTPNIYWSDAPRTLQGLLAEAMGKLRRTWENKRKGREAGRQRKRMLFKRVAFSKFHLEMEKEDLRRTGRIIDLIPDLRN